MGIGFVGPKGDPGLQGPPGPPGPPGSSARTGGNTTVVGPRGMKGSTGLKVCDISSLVRCCPASVHHLHSQNASLEHAQ